MAARTRTYSIFCVKEDNLYELVETLPNVYPSQSKDKFQDWMKDKGETGKEYQLFLDTAGKWGVKETTQKTPYEISVTQMTE